MLDDQRFRRNRAAALLTVLLAALVCALPCASRGQTNPEEQRERAVRGVPIAAVEVDGRLDEEGWIRGPWYTHFITTGTEQPAAPQTRFAVRFDERYLYVGILAFEPRAEQIRREVTERDGKVFRDDCVEFMIDPTGDRAEYYHVAVNARGTLYDAQVRQGGHVMTKEWNCDALAAGAVLEDAFSVEVAIPFVSLGLTPRSAEQPWAIQVARERHAGGALELSSYIRSGGSFHVPGTYAPLTLEGADLARFLWVVKGPLNDMVSEADDGYAYRFKALVTNGSGRFRFTTLTAALTDEPDTAVTVSGGQDNGQQQTYEFLLPFRRTGQHTLELTVADRQAPAVPLTIRSWQVDLDYTPLKLTVRRPFYRNTIYATEAIATIEVDVDLRLPAAALNGLKLEGALYADQTIDSAVVSSAAVAAREGAARLSLPVGELSYGAHALLVTAKLADGAEFSATAVIHKVRPVEHEWRIDENLVLLHNGEPFFPYGWFSAPAEDAEKLRREGVTAVQNYSAQWGPPERTLAWLDTLHEHGLVGCFYPWPSNAFMKNFREPVSAEEEQALRERVRAFRDHPALFAYYMWDEPELRPMLVERSDRLYEIVAEEDPYHPCIMLNDTVRGIFVYRNGGDVLMPDPYPLFSKGAYAGRPIQYTTSFMEACREASEGKKAWWITPQAFDYFMNKPNSRCPTFTELRNQQLQALINGARGILWYTYSHRYNYEDLDLGIPFLGREVQRLRPALLAPEQRDAVIWKAAEQDHMQATVRLVGDDLYVFAVNTNTAPQSAVFQLKGASPERLWVVSENRSVSVSEGRFSDEFALYGGHIYTTNREVAQGPTLAETRQAIAAAAARRHKPGNLAYRGLGTSVTASSISPYSGQLSMTIDGMTKGKGWTDYTWREWPDWIEVKLSEPAKVGRVVVYTSSIETYRIQLRQNGELVDVAEGTSEAGQPIVATFPPQTAEAVRVVAESSAGDRTSVTEIEVYEP